MNARRRSMSVLLIGTAGMWGSIADAQTAPQAPGTPVTPAPPVEAGSQVPPAAQTPPAGPIAAAADSPTGLEDVVVTARRREENLQKVPVAVTALSASTLREREIVTSADVQFATPSLSIGGGPAYSLAGGNYSIRGLGQGLFGPSSVTSYFAEVPGGPSGPGAPLFDVQSIQVLKGPQGTLFGRATVGGAVLITPNRPNLKSVEGYIRADTGEFGRIAVEGALSVPLVADSLAVRLAAYRSHTDGYAAAVNTGGRFGEATIGSVRAAVTWRPTARFENYTLVDIFQTRGTPSAFVLSATDPNFALYNLPPAGTPAGQAAGAVSFNAACTTAVRTGLQPDFATCVNAHLAVVNNIKATLAAELARQAAGGSVRAISASTDFPLFERSQEFDFIDILRADFGHLLGTSVSFKNVLGYIRSRNVTASDDDGTSADILQSGFSGSRSGAQLPGDFGTASTNQIGNQAFPTLGRWGETVSEEPQLSGNTAGNTLVWTLGAFFQYSPLRQDRNGVGNLNKVLGGALTANLGYAASLPFPIGGYNRSKAVYGQFTLDFSPWLLDGLKFTAGYRHTWDHQVTTSAAAVFNYPAGTATPGTQSTVEIRTSGPGYNFTLDYQAARDLFFYVARRRGYRPGGVNNLVGANTLPQFGQTYGPETIEDVEVGAKWTFQLGDVRGRINADYYHSDYSNIQRTFRGISALGTSVTYFVNVGSESLNGIELEGDLLFGRHISINFEYSHDTAQNNNWVASDPLNKVPGFINLSNNPIPNAPKDKGSITFAYTAPLSDTLGNLRFGVTPYFQSRTWFTDSGYRQIQYYGPGIADGISQKPYALLNLRIDWLNAAGSGVDAAVFLRNATDTVYAYSGNPQLQTLGIANKLYAEPRTWGIELQKTF